MKIHDIDFQEYISNNVIEKAIADIAAQINKDYENSQEPVLLLITLAGAVIFGAQLCKHLTIDVELAFVKCSSYGTSRTSSGRVIFQVEPTASLLGRDVIVVEDIVDTGNTWVALHTYIEQQGANSLAIATLMLKDKIYDKPLPLDYVALRVDSEFLIGYGLDYNQLGRNLNAIYKSTSC